MYNAGVKFDIGNRPGKESQADDALSRANLIDSSYRYSNRLTGIPRHSLPPRVTRMIHWVRTKNINHTQLKK